jgi:hypothetical protein
MIKMVSERATGRGLRELSNGLVILLVVKSLIAAMIAVDFLSYAWTHGDEPAVVAHENGVGVWLTFPNRIALYLTVVTWLVWQARAHRALRGQAVQGLRFSPLSGVLWWFVPVANLVMPYRAVKELATAGAASGARSKGTARMLLWSWWVPWLGQLCVAEAIFFSPRNTVSTVLVGVSEVCVLLALPGAVAAVRGITRRLEAPAVDAGQLPLRLAIAAPMDIAFVGPLASAPEPGVGSLHLPPPPPAAP